MKKTLILLSCCAFGLGSTAEATDFGNIVFIGDSITEASSSHPPAAGDGDQSWRYTFWTNLVDHNDDYAFVGSRTSNQSGSTAYPTYNGQTFENRHEAIWGTNSTERLNTLNSGAHWGDLNRDGSNQAADTAFLLIGCNDFASSNPSQAILDGVVSRIGAMVQQLQAANGDVEVYLISVLPRFTADTDSDGFFDLADGRNDDYQAINSALADFENSLSTANSGVHLVDLYDQITPQMFYDGIHPNAAGETFIGNAVYNASVPEPGALALLSLGGLVIFRRRRSL